MRKIRFRGKSVSTGKWVYDNLYHHVSGVLVITAINDSVNVNHEVIPETIGEYIGMADCNGVDIYEGDIVDIRGYSKSLGYFIKTRIVEYNGCSFNISPFYDEIEIVGNKIDDKEYYNG